MQVEEGSGGGKGSRGSEISSAGGVQRYFNYNNNRPKGSG
jgi:hypothetical protein